MKVKVYRWCLGTWMCMASQVVLAIEKVKMGGQDLEVKDNDIVALGMQIGLAAVGCIFGVVVLKGAFETLSTTWAKYADHKKGQAELHEVVWPGIIGAFLVIATLAIAYYVVSNFNTFF